MPTLDYFVSRTNQKLSFARVHLDELRIHPSRNTGDDFERSHHESFFFHLYGAVDAFLQEINIYYSCGLPVDKVTRDALKVNLKRKNCVCPELSELEAAESNQGGSLANAKEFRHHVAHRGGIPMQHYLNGPSNLVNPTTRVELAMDSIKLLDQWFEQLSNLLDKLRTCRVEGQVSRFCSKRET